ncbi:DUF2637 domain-containing protein [uncultured Microbacterium sp.]|uniref:DUF2637 domain-containing protein n=1 Tax=uncultured Microbacterium sp. TaxID=191216 RepID=UPI0028D38C11|nr:DUF2637 domain-containing protein [uncultured Microbacterium sp.]
MNRTGPGGIRLAMLTAVVGTVFIAAGAFWLSFTSLADLARRSGLAAEQAWAWPLIVDGIIVVATVAVVVLGGSRGAWYPWMLLFAGALISVTGNALHAVVTATSEVPLVLAAAVAAIPPLVLLAITHLTSVLTRHASVPALSLTSAPLKAEMTLDVVDSTPPTDSSAGPVGAVELHASGWSNRAIARHLGVHPSTVGRWLRDHVAGPQPENVLPEGG